MNSFLKSIILASILFTCSCKKQQDWLDVSNSRSKIIPKTLREFQAILDNDLVMNEAYPSLGLAGTDNYYMKSVSLPLITSIYEKNAYSWEKDIFENYPIIPDWNDAYKVIAYTNIVLDGLAANHETDLIKRNEVKGTALFFRSFSFYNLALIFSEPYDSAKAATALGIPIRLTSDVNILVGRTTMEQTYRQIIDDLLEAAGLLPDNASFITRPTKTAAHALLAKVYLTMGKYGLAFTHTDKALQTNAALQNFNTLSTSTTVKFPFPAVTGGITTNKEIIFYARSNSLSRTVNPYATYGIIDTLLYNSYLGNDLRKPIFYVLQSGVMVFKGTYNGSLNRNFGGLATNELYLTRAECYARQGNAVKALQDLNALLKTRFVTNSYIDLQSNDAEQVLQWVLTERRKELPFTGQVRWDDLRRLNKDPRFAITLMRIVNGAEILLPPNDKRYALPIPDYELQMNPMPQNPR